MFNKYVAMSSTQKRDVVTYRNLFPNQKQKAIKQRSELGFISFERAKQTQPMTQMVYTKFQRGDPVEANKAVFMAAPNLAEFAKELPPFNPKNLTF